MTETKIQILVNARLSGRQAKALLNVAEAFVASEFADDIGEAGDQLYETGFINQVEHEALQELDDRLKLFWSARLLRPAETKASRIPNRRAESTVDN